MRTSRRHAVHLRPLAVAVLSLFLMPSPCAAQKTDTIVLRNGDRFTGEIKSLQFGYLEVSTDSLSTVMVVWLDVVEVTSTHRFVVEVGSGQQHIGALQSPAPGTLQVGDPQAQPLDISDVVSIRPGRSKLLARVDGSLELDFTVARANNQKQWPGRLAALGVGGGIQERLRGAQRLRQFRQSSAGPHTHQERLRSDAIASLEVLTRPCLRPASMWCCASTRLRPG
jgi:hypothetical protein